MLVALYFLKDSELAFSKARIITEVNLKCLNLEPSSIRSSGQNCTV